MFAAGGPSRCLALRPAAARIWFPLKRLRRRLHHLQFRGLVLVQSGDPLQRGGGARSTRQVLGYMQTPLEIRVSTSWCKCKRQLKVDFGAGNRCHQVKDEALQLDFTRCCAYHHQSKFFNCRGSDPSVYSSADHIAAYHRNF